jgi:hypothetical protein
MVDAKRRMPEKFALRLPEGTLKKVEALAKANNRSMNAEIAARLAASFVETSLEANNDFDPSGLRTPITLSEKIKDQGHAIIHILNFMSSVEDRLSELENVAKDKG